MGAAQEQAHGEVSDEFAQAEELEALAEAEARGDVESPLLHPARGSERMSGRSKNLFSAEP
jgi:hypothetical protein